MARILKHPATGPTMPKSLSDFERTLWEDAIASLRKVGQLRCTTRRSLRAYVRRMARTSELREELTELRSLIGVLEQRSIGHGQDQALFRRAAAAARELTYCRNDEFLRNVNATLNFLKSHRMTPRSRMERR